MSWFIKAQNIRYISKNPNDEYDEEYADQYFAIGHGDWHDNDEEFPAYLVWVFHAGRILKSKTSTDGDPGTHGTNWGHDLCDTKYKGRYELNTGRISVVRPCSQQKEPVPSQLMRALYNEFTVKEVFVF